VPYHLSLIPSPSDFSFSFFSTGTLTQGLRLEPLHQPIFVTEFFKIVSRELFAWAGFKPQYSESLPPE
jgi:hypothetical protein